MAVVIVGVADAVRVSVIAIIVSVMAFVLGVCYC